MNVPKVSSVLKTTGFTLEEWEYFVACEQCRVERALSTCKMTVHDDQRTYRCAVCNDISAIIRRPGDKPIPNSGYRINDWVFCPVNRIFATVNGHTVAFGPMSNAVLPPGS